MARFGFLSSYPPTRCGLATFTDALANSMTQASDDAFVVRVIDGSSPPLPMDARTRVRAHLRNGDPSSVAAAGRALNGGDIAVIQHEYGIYGGPDGDEVIAVLDAVTVPTIVVFHTVLTDPTPRQKWVLEQVAQRATIIVVMTDTARSILDRGYSIDTSKVQVIPHGVPSLPHVTLPAKSARPTVLTWGLIGPGKGIEWAIRAFAQLTDMHPRPAYRVLGQTHPKVLAQDGDVYRDRLNATVTALGLDDTVTIDGRYLSAEDLARNILAADLVLLPYDNRCQVTSGVLAEAVSAGKPVVATAFPHAIELSRSGAVRIIPQENPAAIAAALRQILSRSEVAASMARAALSISRDTLWPAVGVRYRQLAVGLRATVAA